MLILFHTCRSSLIGRPDLALQHHMIAGIKSSPVKLFSPSDLALLFDEEAKAIPVVKAKLEAEQAAKEAGIPTTSIMVNSFAESGLDAPYVYPPSANCTGCH